MGGKYPKDPKAPKRPQTAYFMFMAKARPAVLKERPELKSNVAALGKLIGQMWGNLDDSEKAGLQAKAAKGLVAYRKKADVYRKTAGFKKYVAAKKEFNKKNKAAKRIKALKKSLKNQPKRAASAYFLFASEERARILKKNPSLRSDVAKVAKLIGEAWGSAAEKDKAKFQTKAAALKVKQDKKIAAYRNSAEWKNYLAEKKQIQQEEKAARKAEAKAEKAGGEKPKKSKKKKASKPKKAKKSKAKKKTKAKKAKKAKKTKKRKASKKSAKKSKRRRK